MQELVGLTQSKAMTAPTPKPTTGSQTPAVPLKSILKARTEPIAFAPITPKPQAVQSAASALVCYLVSEAVKT